MDTKQQIVSDWLPRYTGRPLDEFDPYILLVNFANYVQMFADWHGVPVCGEDKPMPNASADGITLINFGMGSANAATVMDLLTSIQPKACLTPLKKGTRSRIYSPMELCYHRPRHRSA